MSSLFIKQGRLHQISQYPRTVFVWDRVNFLHSCPYGCYGALFWICKQYSVDNTLMFQLLLNITYAAPRLSPYLCHSTPQQIGGQWMRIRGKAPGTADQNRLKGYSVPYNITLSNKTRLKFARCYCCLGPSWASKKNPFNYHTFFYPLMPPLFI